MDPLSILGVAAATVQFVDFNQRLFSETWQIYRSASGQTLQLKNLSAISAETSQLSTAVKASLQACEQGTSALDGPDEQLLDLCQECEDIAYGIITLIDKVNGPFKQELSGGHKPIGECFRTALKSWSKQEEITNISGRLVKLRQDITTAATISIWRNSQSTKDWEHQFSSKLDTMIEMLSQSLRIAGLKDLDQQKNDKKQIAENTQIIEGIVVESMQQNNLTDEIKSRLWRVDWKPDSQLLASFPQETGRSINQIHSLICNSLYFDGIYNREEAITKAFDSTYRWVFEDPQLSAEGSRLWSSLPEWLEGDAGLPYWITGKPGSGKSTMMNPPDGWITWELEESFERFLQLEEGGPRLALFIDGLDEFDAAPTNLCKRIQKVSRYKNVKICVASRPWPQFSDAFTVSPRLQMHLLTNADIETFTRGCLHDVIAFQELNAVYPGRGEALIVDVVRRAKGVFLWTALVNNTLMEHLVEGSNLVHLQEILDTMPSEIEDLYDAIYAAIPTRLLPEVSAMLQLYVQAFQPLDWLTLWLADEVRGNPAATMALLQDLDMEMAQAALQRRLSARTRDPKRFHLVRSKRAIELLEQAVFGPEAYFMSTLNVLNQPNIRPISAAQRLQAVELLLQRGIYQPGLLSRITAFRSNQQDTEICSYLDAVVELLKRYQAMKGGKRVFIKNLLGFKIIISATKGNERLLDAKYGPNTGAQLSEQSFQLTSDIGLPMTTWTNGTCKGAPVRLGEVWIKNISREALDVYAQEAAQRYKSVIRINDNNLTAFYKKGGNILGYHGTHDQLTPVKGTRHYYNKVKDIIPEVPSFYRMFEVPGLLHCSGGKGGQPTNTFDALRAWVENGTVPAQLPHFFKDAKGHEQQRLLCPYPQKAWLRTNDTDKAVYQSTDFVCV
ncbi:feruloyl esterase b precursor [Fusarium pseudoanthophilum]|uniref:Carboxylic ester hydrolase n=1 Tax=Fusarium pseudoanthophilum TaxID=48495 RepID=A0A8H5KKY4_9HYPO|nr:feruloyl esterase b precursor [Fusarium pseudoanthophilum]